MERNRVFRISPVTEKISFADLVHPNLSFSEEVPAHRLLLKLIDTPWVQRLRDVSQTANTRLVYMFSEHSRFGHSLGVAYLADALVEKLREQHGDDVSKYRLAIVAAALLHDIGHLAPGSHVAFKAWFPGYPDTHEELGQRIIREEHAVRDILDGAEDGLSDTVCKILDESSDLPPWTWEVVSGGGWNVDRGNWCTVDSILAGVSYGEYNIPAITDSITLAKGGHLALKENRLDAMMHFAVSRHAMYRQIYQHRVLLAADMINISIVERARDVGADNLPFCDETMRCALETTHPHDLPLKVVFRMREAWWRYHLLRWMDGSDEVLRDLSSRLLTRRLFKTVRVRDNKELQEVWSLAERELNKRGMNPRYYLHQVSAKGIHEGDYRQSMLVQREDGQVESLLEADPLFAAMSKTEHKRWIAMPGEIKEAIGRVR